MADGFGIFSSVTGGQYDFLQRYIDIYKKDSFEAAYQALKSDFGEDFAEGLYTYLNFTVPGKNLPFDYNLNQSKYDFTNRVFPEDIGNATSYNGHYMVININVLESTNFGKVTRTTNTSLGETAIRQTTFNQLDNELSKVDVLRGNIDRTYRDGQGRQLAQPVFVPRRTRRIKESIALYMPNTMVFSNRNSYDEVGLTDLAFRVVQTAANVTDVTGRAVHLGQQVLPVVGQLRQTPINPRVEVLFSSSQLREFQFDFLCAPASATESQALEEIIRTLRFHAAPEFNPLTTDLLGFESLLWVPPSEFDITFFNRGKENTAIPRINTCACTGIDVDYAPSGVYSTFSNGKPVQVRLQLQFKEVEINHKLRIMQGF